MTLPDLPPEISVADIAEEGLVFKADEQTPDARFWKANSAADRPYRQQPPLRRRFYDMKGNRSIKLDYLWHPDAPAHRIAHIRRANPRKSAAALLRHQLARHDHSAAEEMANVEELLSFLNA